MRRLPVRKLAWFGAAAALAGLLALNLLYAGTFVRTWDEADFVFALDRFDLLAMQPHFPGYPFFIGGGMIARLWISDPLLALTAFNALMTAGSAVPIFLLARREVGAGAAAWAAVWVGATPYLWLMGSRPMSECAGIAALWWFLWSVREAADRPRSLWRYVAAAALFGALMGIRLSYFPFGVALVLLLALCRRSFGGGRGWGLLLRLLIAGAFQLVGVLGLMLSEGSVQGFWQLAEAFVAGHFSEWGGGIGAVDVPLAERVATVFGDHLVRDVLLGRSAVVGAIASALLVLVAWGSLLARGRTDSAASGSVEPRYIAWLIICLAAYAVWAVLGQNVEKARHVAPLAGPLLLACYIAAIRTFRSLRLPSHAPRVSRAIRLGIGAVMAAYLCAQAFHGVRLLREQAERPPAVYQLHDYLGELREPFTVYTWEETRVLQYLQADYDHRRIVTYGYFLAVVASAAEEEGAGRRILLTDHVLDGFLAQNPEAARLAVPLARFESNALFDPVYSRITLYEWRGAAEQGGP